MGKIEMQLTEQVHVLKNNQKQEGFPQEGFQQEGKFRKKLIE
jgi:hypothetical protein